jgi:defect-in-organelle-trafficking protein DotC
MQKVSLSLLLFLSGCSTYSNETTTLHSLQKLSDRHATNVPQNLTSIRYNALRDTGMSLGARGGLSFRSQSINHMMQPHMATLDQIFNFERLVLDNRVLPPVLIEGRHTLEQADNQTLRVADRAYIIQSQAHFISAAPTWRDYLWMRYEKPEPPDRSLLPRNKREKAIWADYVEKGWQAGIQQANNIYAQNLNQLERDFTGMVRYRSLLAQNMVSAPFVAKMDLGITGGGHEMAINDRVLRITALPALKSDGQQWQTTLTPESPSE